MSRRTLVPILALVLAATSCGGGDGGGDASGVGHDGADSTTEAAGEEFCEAWLAGAADEGVADAKEDLALGIAHLTALLAAAPESVEAEIADVLENMRIADDLLAPYDYSYDRLATEGSASDIAGMDLVAEAVIDFPAETDTARLAYESCDGAEDPTFLMGCFTATKLTSIGPSVDGPVQSDPGVEDPDELADRRVASNDDIERWEKREAEGGGYEYALLSATGRTVGLMEAVDTDGRWSIAFDATCEGTS